MQEQEQLQQQCLHLQARLDAVQTECQKEREVSEDRQEESRRAMQIAFPPSMSSTTGITLKDYPSCV